jgi:glycosyltransferase involved in cell wall biosynthesis
MGFTVSIVMEDLAYVEPDRPGLDVHGANLSINAQLKEFGARDEVQALEIFVPPKFIADRPLLEKWANLILPKRRRGKGILRLIPVTSLPEVWADGAERIYWSRDPWWMPRERYLRDRFSTGPTPLLFDTHSLGQHEQNERLFLMADAPRVDFDVVCALTSPVAEAYRRIYTHWLTPGQEPPFDIKVLPHAVDTNRFQPATAEVKAFARRTLGLPEEGVIALYFGRLTPNSKADLLPLIHAFDGVAKSGRHLVIGGVENVPGYVARLQQEVEARGLGERVHFLPAVTPSMRHLPYAAADFFVFPGDTVQEALGNTMHEAAACGLPTLISEWDGMKEVSVDGETSIHVPCYWMPCQERTGSLYPILPQMTAYLLMAQTVWIDPVRLAAGLDQLFSDETLRRRLGEAGRRRTTELYGLDPIWKQVTEIWSDALAGARAESEASKLARREHANRRGLAMPILDIFSHYATGVINPDADFVALTSFGEACLAGSKEIQFYDECLPLIHPKALSSLRKLAWSGLQSIQSVAEQMSRESGATRSDSLLQIAFLLKRGVFNLTKGE